MEGIFCKKENIKISTVFFPSLFIYNILYVGSSLKHLLKYSAVSMATESLPTYETLVLSRPEEHVVRVQLNRPEKRNAMNNAFWRSCTH